MDQNYTEYFISYSTDYGKTDAGLIYDALIAHGCSAFISTHDIRGGDEWHINIQEHLENCKYFLLVLNKATIDYITDGQSHYLVDDEIQNALKRKERNEGITIIPILIDGVKMPAVSDLPPSIKSLHDNQGIRVDHILNKTALNRVLEKELHLEPLPEQHSSFTWEELQQISRIISIRNYEKKYNEQERNLLIQRHSVLQTFNQFLTSEYCVFTLVGDSGTGKTSFLVKYEDESQADDDICCIYLNAATLDPEMPIEKQLLMDFQWSQAASQNITDLFIDISKIPQLAKNHAQVILCIDAINNSTNASKLKENIDALAKHPPSWLKVIVTSTPVLWERLFSEQWGHTNYFLPNPEANQRGSSAVLGFFSNEELALAFTKYQAVYGFTTDYDELSEAMKATLQDPMALDLISRVNGNQNLPTDTTMHSVIPRYIDELEKSEVGKEAIDFLQKDLLPVMLGQATYKNRVQTRELQKTSINQRTLKRNLNYLRQKDILSCYNLLSTEDDQNGNYEYYFSMERYFDYFSGHYLYENFCQINSIRAKVSTLKSLIQRINDYKFLYGPIRNLIINIIQEEDDYSTIFLQLSNDSNKLTQDLVSATLIEYYPSHRAIIEKLLENWAKLWKLRMPQGNIFWKLVAIEIAAAVKNEDILLLAMDSKGKEVRARAITVINRLWNNDPSTGKTILTKHLKKIKWTTLLLQSHRIESGLGVTLLIYLNSPDENQDLLDLWKPIFKQVTFSNLAPKRGWGRKIFLQTRKLILFLLIKIALSIRKSIPGRYDLINMDELKAYYKLPAHVKQTALELINILEKCDPNHVLEDKLENLFGEEVDGKPLNNMLLKLLIDYVLVSEALREQAMDLNGNIKNTLAIIDRYYEKELSSPSTYKRCMWDKTWVYCAIAYLQDDISQDLIKSLEEFITKSFINVVGWEGQRAYAYLGYADYARIDYKNRQTTNVVLLKKLMDWAVKKEKDYQKARDILEELAYLAASPDPLWKISLFVMEDVFIELIKYENLKNHGGEAERKILQDIKEKTIKILALINTRHPYAIRSFLRDKNHEELFNEISILKVTEDVAGLLLKGGLGTMGQFEVSQGFSEKGREHMVWIARTACTSSSLSNFLFALANYIINLLINRD